MKDDTANKQYLAGQAESRFPVWWRFRGAAFAGPGDGLCIREEDQWLYLEITEAF